MAPLVRLRLPPLLCAALLSAAALAPAAAANPDPDAALDAGFGQPRAWPPWTSGAPAPPTCAARRQPRAHRVINRIEGEAVIGWLAADELVPLGIADVRLFDLAVGPDDRIVVAGRLGDDSDADVFVARLWPGRAGPSRGAERSCGPGDAETSPPDG